jgi:endonuclease/exonuclease/phosphatase family metal-dependent hydrolase
MKTTAVLLAALLLASTGGAAPAGATGDGIPLSVMTRNQYFGGDLFAVAAAPDAASFMAAVRAVLMDIAASNFPERAQAFARDIAERRPDIVGLQEVYDFKLNGENTGAPPFLDQLQVTMTALAAAGAGYVVVASVQNLWLALPADLDGDGVPESVVSVMDRDVILARADIAGQVTPVPFSAYCARPSADGGPGCNFFARAEAPTPFGLIPLDRGFVGVDVALGGRTFRVVNTHLEVENLSADPWAPYYQSAQAYELKALLDATSGSRTVIVMGDINSTPVDPLFPDPLTGPLARPFRQFTEGVDLFNDPAGRAYFDAWLLRPGNPAGFTCCFEDLAAPYFDVTERKDVVFVSHLPVSVKANVLGNDSSDKTPSGLWPSDHAGVWVRFTF